MSNVRLIKPKPEECLKKTLSISGEGGRSSILITIWLLGIIVLVFMIPPVRQGAEEFWYKYFNAMQGRAEEVPISQAQALSTGSKLPPISQVEPYQAGSKPTSASIWQIASHWLDRFFWLGCVVGVIGFLTCMFRRSPGQIKQSQRGNEKSPA